MGGFDSEEEEGEFEQDCDINPIHERDNHNGDEFEGEFNPNASEEELELSDDFDPNVDDNEINDDFDPNVDDVDDEFDDDFDPNVNDVDDEFDDDFDPNMDDADFEDEFDPKFDPNVNEEEFEEIFNPNETEENHDDFDQENVDGFQSTVQVSPNPEAEEEYSDDIEELTDSELFEEFWEKFDELEREGLSPEEIKDIMQKAEETYEALREGSEPREKEVHEKQKKVDHLNEKKSEDYSEEIVNSERKTEEEIVEDGEIPKEKDLETEDQNDEEIERDYPEVIGNTEQMQKFIDKIVELAENGKSDEEIVEILENEESIDNFNEYIEILHQKEVQENLKNADHLEEEDQEDWKNNEIDNPTAVQSIVDKVDCLSEKGISNDEIIDYFKREEEFEELDEKVKELHEKEVQESLKQVDHYGEEDQEDWENKIDIHIAAQEFVDNPEETFDNGRSEVKSKEKEDLKEFVKLVRRLHEQEVQEAFKQVDHLEEEMIDDIEEEMRHVESDRKFHAISEVSDEIEKVEPIEDEEFEKLKELYKKETGKRAIYAGKETKMFSRWLVELIKESNEIVEQIKEQEDEEWQKTLRKWINDASEEINTELKGILMELIDNPDFYERLRDYLIEFSRLVEKLEKEILSDQDREMFLNDMNDLMKTSLIHLNLHENLRAFKDFFDEHSVWNPQHISRIKEAFLSRLSQKFEMMAPENYKNSKKCGLCKKLLPLEEFGVYGSSRGKKKGLQRYRSVCKNCGAKQKVIREYRNKFLIAFTLFNGKCQVCRKDLAHFPAFEFHHLDSSIKKISWRKIRGKSYEFIMKTVIKEKMVPLCGNCHLDAQAKYFNKYKDLILTKDLFKFSQEEIENLIDNTLGSLTSDEKRKIKYQLKRWLRKRYVVETLYGNNCLSCDTNVIDNLPAIVFHHIDESKKKHTWRDLRDLDSKDIIKNLIKEKCIAMCSNCHTALHTRFDENISEILRNIIPDKDILKVYNFFKNLDVQNKINDFAEKNLYDKDYRSPLKYDTVPTDIWKIKTLKLLEFLRENEINEFRTKEAAIPFNNHYHRTYELIQKLKENNLIKQVQKKDNTQNYFQFTESGIKKVEEFQGRFKEKYKEIQDNTKITTEGMVNTSRRIENDDVFIIYPKLIKKIIERKGYNEFTAKELQKEVKKSLAQISKIIKGKLLPGGYIREVLNPKHMQKKGTTKFYQLTM